MPKPQKVEAVAKLKERFEESDAALLAEYRGLKVSEMKELRRTLAGAGAAFKVVKNTLTRRAVQEANLDELLPLLEGSTAIAFIKGDPVAAAKGLDELSKKYPALVIKGGLLDGRVFDADKARALANVKPREVLLAQLAGMLQSPVQKLATLLSAPVRELGYVLAAYQDKLAKEAPAAAAEPAETPAAEAPVTPAVESAAADQPAAEAEPDSAAEAGSQTEAASENTDSSESTNEENNNDEGGQNGEAVS